MLKKISVAAMVAAMSFATVPAMVSVAQAQGANEPPTAPDPSDAMKGGGDMSKGDMSKDSMSKSSMKKGSMKHHMKKHHMKKHM